MATKLGSNIVALIVVILVLVALALLFPYAGQGAPPITHALNVSTLVNRSNALFGIPNPNSFTFSSNFSESPPPHHNNYTTIGTMRFESKAYGLNSTGVVVNYSSPISPFEYTINTNSSKGDNPVSVIIYVWKYNTPDNATARYLGLLHNSMGEGYNYSHYLNVLNYSNHKGDINYSYPTMYEVLNGNPVELNGTNASVIVKNGTSLASYLSSSLIQFGTQVSMTTPRLFSCVVYPVYGNLIQSQETVGYGQYVVSVYTMSPLGRYNQSYGRNIAMHMLTLLESNTYA